MKKLLLAIVLASGFAAPAAAGPNEDPRSAFPGALLGGIVQERDVGLVFDYLRQALQAAVDGREPPSSDELAQRAEVIGDEVKRRGAAAARAVIDAIEQSVREGMREPRPLPPPASAQQRL
jgi:hypothetical protein